jgi:kynurenine formamidase
MSARLDAVVSKKQISLAEFRKLTERYSNWSRWGRDDQRGTLNYNTPQTIRSARSEIRSGKTLSLAIPLDNKGPQRGLFGRFNPILLMTRDGGDAITGAYSADWLGGEEKETRSADEVIVMPTQCATHWDSLAHIIHRDVMYNGRSAAEISSTGAKANGIFASRGGIVGRGVLLDIPRSRRRNHLAPGEGISSDWLEETAERQSVRVREGDIVMVRTGHMAAARARGDWGDYAGGPAPGLSLDALEWISKKKVAAVASDTWGIEVQPFEVKEVHIPFHVAAIVYMGLTLGEIFELDPLASDCAKDGRYSFFLSAQPLPFTKGVASPINPIAIK